MEVEEVWRGRWREKGKLEDGQGQRIISGEVSLRHVAERPHYHGHLGE